MLHIIGRDFRVHTNSTYVQINISSTCIWLSPAGYIGAFVWTLEDARTLPEFNYIWLLKFCYHPLCDRVTLRIYLYDLRSMHLAGFSLRVFRVFEVWDLHILPILIKTAYVIASYLILFYRVTYSLIIPTSFLWAVKIQLFYHNLVLFTIAVSNWYAFT